MTDLYNKCSSATNARDDQFIGIRYDGDVSIVFPVGYEIPYDIKDLRKEILILIESFELTTARKKDNIYEGTTYKDELKLPIHSYFWLIKDYIDKGLYKENEKEIKQKVNGKINWKKTIQKTQPMISNDGFVYLDPYSEKTKNTDTLITEIEKYCLNLANEFFGWLFGELRIQKSIFDDKKIGCMLDVLKKELMISYSDYKKCILTHMINILTGLDDDHKKSRVFSYGTYNYNIVWEELVDSVFGNVKDIEEYYPTAYWDLSKLKIKNQNQAPLRQDAIYVNNKTGKYYIFDAKYYGASLSASLSGLPSTADIEKQITYGQELSIDKGINPNMIYNALILPYNKENNTFDLHDDIEYIGVANPSWIKKQYSYENIELIFVDSRYLLNRWKKNNESDITEMMRVIEANQHSY